MLLFAISNKPSFHYLFKDACVCHWQTLTLIPETMLLPSISCFLDQACMWDTGLWWYDEVSKVHDSQRTQNYLTTFKKQNDWNSNKVISTVWLPTADQLSNNICFSLSFCGLFFLAQWITRRRRVQKGTVVSEWITVSDIKLLSCTKSPATQTSAVTNWSHCFQFAIRHSYSCEDGIPL